MREGETEEGRVGEEERVGTRGGGQRSGGGRQGRGEGINQEKEWGEGFLRTLPATIVLNVAGRESHGHQRHSSRTSAMRR